jgi:hypothetical protein
MGQERAFPSPKSRHAVIPIPHLFGRLSVRALAELHPALDALPLDFESISAQSSMAVGDAMRRGGVENSTPGARFLLVLPTVHSNCE